MSDYQTETSQDELQALAAEQDRQHQEPIEALQRELGLTA